MQSSYGGGAVSVCRLSIQSDLDGLPVMLDVALPTGTPVGALLPTLVELAGQSSLTSPQSWRLDQLSGSTLDDSISLAENGVHDGELLILASSEAPPLGLLAWNPCRTVADTDPPECPTATRRDAVCVWAAVIAALALCAGAAPRSGIHLLVAAGGTCAAAILAVLSRSTAAGVAAAVLAAATGFLAVPSGPGAANFFLAAAAASCTALLMLRWSDDWSSTLIATTCFSALAAAAALVSMTAVVPVATAGGVLVVGAVGLLAVSGRISVLLAGLAPDRHADDCAERAVRGHVALTGLVEAGTGAVALGAVLVAIGCLRDGGPPVAGAAFAAVVGVVLLLRVRTHVDAGCRRSLACGGLASATAAFTVIAVTFPEHAGWLAAGGVVFGLGAVRPPTLNAAALRAVAVFEYAVLVAVVPLVCWVGGVYALVRGVHPS